MASKYHPGSSLIYIDGTDVPHNKLGITEGEELHEIESELLEEAYQVFNNELDENTVFDEAYFKSLHQRTFNGLYEWAGKYRDFNMSKAIRGFVRALMLKAVRVNYFPNWQVWII